MTENASTRSRSEGTGKSRVRVFISGTVQGVGFRYSTQIQAERLSLSGWVRNRRDGRVEAVFEGDRSAVESALAWCRRGPVSAVVTDLSSEWETPEGLVSFELRPTV
ncbi:MAG: acylphosphatase [Cyanobacteria bacterium SID2]|nr:acylphosphatase [Cyanobacteria bacterium SID2]MBP0006159.1 acylphosphatase [Cyanobacteria bacterium SBC]